MPSGHQLPNRVFPVPYQVDFSVESKGRHLDSTKRKLTWKVGFAHSPAVFPHLYDANENYMGDVTSDGSIIPYPQNPKKGVECRGREHEIILTWSLLTGKAHIYVDSREIYRHEPIKDEIFNPFSAQFHRGFDLPNAKFNGRHRIDIRCYARTPMGAKNMVVDDAGGKFRQYDLTVDGLSYFSMPAVFELGTDRMWSKVSRWGLTRAESQAEEVPRGGGQQGEHRHHGNNSQFESRGRMVDDYYFDKAKKGSSQKYGQSISKTEYKAMNPRSESEEERMIRKATEASMKDWEKKDMGYGQRSSSSGGYSKPPSSSSEENDSSYGNGRKESGSRGGHAKKSTQKMASIGEGNLIDFGTDEAANAMSQITISRQTTSDISVLDNDDATTASFMMNTAWNSGGGYGAPPPPPPQQAMVSPPYPYHQQQQAQPPPPPPQQAMLSPMQPSPVQQYPYHQQQQAQPPPHYQDPTFQQQYAQQPWSSVGTLSTPRNSADMPSDASFAVAPPPTLDDFRNAFGGSVMNMGASVVGGSTVMTTQPMSPGASVGMTSPMQQQQMPQYGMQQASQWQSQSYGAPGGGPGMGASPQVSKTNTFDPMRADPFAS